MVLTDEQYKDILHDAICGLKINFKTHRINELEKNGMIHFCGNQWNDEWVWNNGVIKKLKIPQLEALYSELKEELKEELNK